jgi:hypothetical protein
VRRASSGAKPYDMTPAQLWTWLRTDGREGAGLPTEIVLAGVESKLDEIEAAARELQAAALVLKLALSDTMGKLTLADREALARQAATVGDEAWKLWLDVSGIKKATGHAFAHEMIPARQALGLQAGGDA